MTSVESLLAGLRAAGVTVWAEGDRLRYRAPKGALSAHLRDQMAAQKHSLLAFLHAAADAVRDAAPGISRVPRDRSLPLSFAQERLWLLDQLEDRGTAYNEGGAIRLRGSLDRAGLAWSLTEIVRRHEVLRTTFRMSDRGPVQVISPIRDLALPVIDLQSQPEAERVAAVERLARQDARQPFDLADGPLVRTSLLRLSPREHVLLLSMHHIAADYWSAGIFFRELAALYRAFITGSPAALPSLPIQYADFAVWQRDALQGPRLAALLEYWRRALAGAPELLALPADRRRPAIYSTRGATERFSLDPGIVSRLKAIGQGVDATLHMLLLAGYAAWLGRYCGETDLIIGSPVASRPRAEVEGLIGFFANTLVQRVRLDDDPCFLEILGRVREVALGAYEHQDLPFERLVEALRPNRDLGHTPLCQVMFALQNVQTSDWELPGLTIAPLEIDRGTAKYDLTLFVREEGATLSGAFEYRTDLFDTSTARRMVSQLRQLFEAATAEPRRRLSELNVLDRTERERVLVAWNRTTRPLTDARLVHERVAAHARETAEAPAVVAGAQVLTYRDLDHRANRLARRLQARGLGPEARVAICLERSPALVIAALGVLKAGGAYIPLDPAQPRARLDRMLTESGARLLVTVPAEADRLASPALETLYLDDDDEARDDVRDDRTRAADPERLAYVIFTSGSTGTPRGVAVTHGALLNLVDWHLRAFEVTARDRATLIAGVGFDASVWELWPSLAAGAAIHIPDETTRRSPDLLRDWLIASRINVSFLPTPMWEQLASLSWPARTSLRTILTGGDVLHRVADTELPFTLVNNYGPTETAVVATSTPLQPGPTEAAPPIGRPIDNTRIYLLSQALQPVGIGTPGELCVAGPSLARGYLDDPALTAAKFIPDPFSTEPGARLYRTGDLARFRGDGQIEFLGRTDRQTKIRGIRIERAEIEARLVEHAAVREAVVEVHPDGRGEPRLVAYVVAEAESGASDARRRELAEARVTAWEGVFDEHVYSGAADEGDPRLNTVGWQSSYDDGPIPAEQMAAYRDGAVAEVLSLHPQRVLEVGCGTGMLLFQIAPVVERYDATDFSGATLDYVRRHLPTDAAHRVRLTRCLADDFSGVPTGFYDVVLLNSVVQYFPDVGYLLRVIERALRALRPGGCLVLGNLRSLPLLRCLHASVQLHRAAPAMRIDELRQQIDAAMMGEEELLVDPALFTALQHRHPECGRIELRLERGRQPNELNLFRFVARVHVRGARASEGGAAEPAAPMDGRGASLAMVRDRFARGRPGRLLITGIADARLGPATRAAALVASPDAPETVDGLRRALAREPETGIAPEDLWALGDELGYRVELFWSGDGTSGRIDARFVDAGVDDHEALDTMPSARVALPASESWERYANNPLRSRLARELTTTLKQHLGERLPEAMVPTAWMVLDALPRTATGKLDRRALPSPDSVRPAAGGDLAPPRTATEAALCTIWAELLGRDEIGVHQNFFELGGHSLLATQVAVRGRETFRIDLTVRSLFERPTVASLAREIDARRGRSEEAALVNSSGRPVTPALSVTAEREEIEL